MEKKIEKIEQATKTIMDLCEGCAIIWYEKGFIGKRVKSNDSFTALGLIKFLEAGVVEDITNEATSVREKENINHAK